MTSPDLTAALEGTMSNLAHGVPLSEQGRAGRQLRELYAQWQARETEAARFRHITAPNAERARVQAMEAFAECAATALNLSEESNG